MNRYLLCCGDATDQDTWSSTPYHLLAASRRAGLLCDGLRLHPGRLRWRRSLWNVAQMLRRGKPGGFQYTALFGEALLRQAGLRVDQPLALLSHFPLLPSWPWPPSWSVDFYIDATTHQVFDDYGLGRRIAADLQARVLEQERRAYRQARAVICLSQWAADSVIGDYGIDPAKVHVVPGGANLEEALLAHLPATPPPPAPSAEQPLRLGFLGKEWRRKGGPFLLELAEALQQRGLPTVIRAIGPGTADLPSHPALEALGFLDKRRDTARFVAELQSWHFGTLFSSAEAFGISNRECLRLGVPVLCHAVGGIPSTLPDAGCGQLFEANPSAAEVADWIVQRLDPYEGYLAWRAALAPRWRDFSWEAAVAQLQPILMPSPEGAASAPLQPPANTADRPPPSPGPMPASGILDGGYAVSALALPARTPSPARLLVCCGDATQPDTHGGLPHALFAAGQGQGFLQGALALQPRRLDQRRILWNGGQLLRGSFGGFQYSPGFLAQLWRQARLDPDQPLRLLSIYPLLPPQPWPAAWEVSFYLDATTRQVFEHYRLFRGIARRQRQRILERERRNLQAATAIVCRSVFTADSVIADYGIDPAKVHVVPGGANLEEALLAHLPAAPPPPAPSAEQPLRLGFLGKEWRRKGGPFLLELAEALQQRGLPTVIRAIGPRAADLPSHPALQPLGFLDKRRDTARFVAELQSWHFGTLFSSAEAFGISNRECLRLGVPVLCHAVGGIPSTLPDAGCGQLFEANPSAAEVADWIVQRLNPYEGYLAWRAALAPRWRDFSWDAAVQQLAAILD